jgi:hypothetical protein
MLIQVQPAAIMSMYVLLMPVEGRSIFAPSKKMIMRT